jgi:hypothetical protein
VERNGIRLDSRAWSPAMVRLCTIGGKRCHARGMPADEVATPRRRKN